MMEGCLKNPKDFFFFSGCRVPSVFVVLITYNSIQKYDIILIYTSAMNGVITPPYIRSYRLVTGVMTYIIYIYIPTWSDLVRFSVQLSISPLSDFQILFRIYDFVGSMCSGGAIFL